MVFGSIFLVLEAETDKEVPGTTGEICSFAQYACNFGLGCVGSLNLRAC